MQIEKNDGTDATRMASAIAMVEPVDVEITRAPEWREVRRSVERLAPRADEAGW